MLDLQINYSYENTPRRKWIVLMVLQTNEKRDAVSVSIIIGCGTQTCTVM